MNIIILRKNHGQSKNVSLGPKSLIAIASSLGVFVFLAFLAGYLFHSKFGVNEGEVLAGEAVELWRETLDEQYQGLSGIKRETKEQIGAITKRVATMQASLMRLDALGQHLTEESNLSKSEFDFTSDPAVGGPDTSESASTYTMVTLNQTLADLERKVLDREHQLRLLSVVLENRQLEDAQFISGRPVKWGWLSSEYGFRADPFTGKRAWHAGVDYAGKDGSDIISVAAGVVEFAGKRYGYGNLVEINHGNGFTTRYAHCKAINVEVGDVVDKGASIAIMGSTGRSTGPHVHYEVLKNGRTLNPQKYVLRAGR